VQPRTFFLLTLEEATSSIFARTVFSVRVGAIGWTLLIAPAERGEWKNTASWPVKEDRLLLPVRSLDCGLADCPAANSLTNQHIPDECGPGHLRAEKGFSCHAQNTH
jgi:hypothetical protein